MFDHQAPLTRLLEAVGAACSSSRSRIFIEFHRFSLIFIGFHWFSLIFIGFHWFFWFLIGFCLPMVAAPWSLQRMREKPEGRRRRPRVQKLTKNVASVVSTYFYRHWRLPDPFFRLLSEGSQINDFSVILLTNPYIYQSSQKSQSHQH